MKTSNAQGGGGCHEDQAHSSEQRFRGAGPGVSELGNMQDDTRSQIPEKGDILSWRIETCGGTARVWTGRGVRRSMAANGKRELRRRSRCIARSKKERLTFCVLCSKHWKFICRALDATRVSSTNNGYAQNCPSVFFRPVQRARCFRPRRWRYARSFEIFFKYCSVSWCFALTPSRCSQ